MAEQHSLNEDYETPYKFNGKELDTETGLYYYGARYYDPRTSIWLSADPLMENAPNVNPYVYCEDNPINMTDPDGRWPYPSWFNKAVSYAKAAGQGVKNFGSNAVTGVKEKAVGLYNAYKNIPTNPKATLKYAVENSGPAIIYNTVKSNIEKPINIIKKATSGNVEGAISDYTAHLTEGVVALLGAKLGTPAKKPSVSNPVPQTMARVVSADIESATLGRPGTSQVFVTAAEDIRGLNASEIAKKLTIPESESGFNVYEFPTPSSGVSTPLFSDSPGFIRGGRTAGGAREFNIPNGPIPNNAIKRTVE